MLIIPPGALKNQNVYVIFVGGKLSLVTLDSLWTDDLHWDFFFFPCLQVLLDMLLFTD